jgi:hypothetical protein
VPAVDDDGRVRTFIHSDPNHYNVVPTSPLRNMLAWDEAKQVTVLRLLCT